MWETGPPDKRLCCVASKNIRHCSASGLQCIRVAVHQGCIRVLPAVPPAVTIFARSLCFFSQLLVSGVLARAAIAPTTVFGNQIASYNNGLDGVAVLR